MPDDQSADSSPAPNAPDLDTLSTAQLDHWRLTGDVPSTDEGPSEAESSPADSTPAEPAEQAASTDAHPEAASEPAPPRKSRNADTRIPELLAERARERARADRLERELAQLRAPRQDATPAAPSPAPGESFAAFDAYAAQHPDASYDDYLVAKFEHVQAQKQQRAQVERQRDVFLQAATERQTGFQQRYFEALTADPHLPERIDPVLYDLKTVDACLQQGEPVTALNAVAQEIVESPVAAKLLVHLSEHPDDLAALSRMSPAAVIRNMAKLEAYMDLPASPPPKRITSAPAVTTTLGQRPAVPGDALERSKREGDYARYRDLANARDMASMK